MNGTASALLAVIGAFLIAAALHGCEVEARPGDYTKRACARGSVKACVRLCDRGFRGYCGSTERRSKSLRTDVRAKRSWPGSAEETRPPFPTPRPFNRLALIDDTFALTEVEPLIPFVADRPKRTRALTISHTPAPVPPPERSLVVGFTTAAVAAGIAVVLFHALFVVRRRRPAATYPDPYLPTM